jgi:RHS repeat-associated protein
MRRRRRDCHLGDQNGPRRGCEHPPGGDVVGTTNAAGAYNANPATDEFGIGTAPASRLGYLGGAERFTTDSALGIIRMGHRLYDPNLGRFLEVDPIPGGSANNYDYTNQVPVNGFDLGGDMSFCSDDYCAPQIACLQDQYPNSALNESELINGANKLRSEQDVPGPKQESVRHEVFHVVSFSVAVVGASVSIFFIGAAAGSATAETLTTISKIDTGLTVVGAVIGCLTSKFSVGVRGAGTASTVVSGATGSRASAPGIWRAARIAWGTAGAAWSYASHWAGF